MTETLGRLGGRQAVSPAAGQEGSMLLAGIVRREGGGKHCWQVRTRHLFLLCFFKVTHIKLKVRRVSKHLLVRAIYAILSSLSGKYCHCRDVFLDIHLHMILSTEAKLHERIICSEWSNMSYKHDIVFSIKSLGLLTQTTHSLVFSYASSSRLYPCE